MARKLLDPSSVREYSHLVTEAVRHGVPFSDLMHETARFHGSEFTLKVLDELGKSHGKGRG